MSTISDGRDPDDVRPPDITLKDLVEQLRVDPSTPRNHSVQIELSLLGIDRFLEDWQSEGEGYDASFLIDQFLALLDHVYACLVRLNNPERRTFSGLFDEHGKEAIDLIHVGLAIRRFKEEDSVPSTTQFFAAIFAYAKRHPNPAQARNVKTGFNTTFVGDTMNSLDSHLLDLGSVDGDPVYSPVVPIVQSSGTGKTRTTVQLLSIRLGLYANARHTPTGLEATSEPKQDPQVFDILSGPDSTSMSDYAAAVAVGSWLVAYTEEFLTFCHTQAGLLFPDRASDFTFMVDEWTVFVEHMADVLKGNIVPDFRVRSQTDSPGRRTTSGVSSSTTLGKPRDLLLRKIHTRALEVKSSFELARKTDAKIANETALREFRKTLEPKFKALEDFLPAFAPYYFLAIDEAICMGTVRLRLLRKLLSGAADLRRTSKIRVLLLDTNNKVSELSALKRDTRPIPKLRLLQAEARIARPFANFPLDLFLMEDEAARASYYHLLAGQSVGTTHAQVAKLITKMGRPLWNDLYYSQDHWDSDYRYYGIDIAAVRKKLLGSYVHPHSLFVGDVTETSRSRLLLPVTRNANDETGVPADLSFINVKQFFEELLGSDFFEWTDQASKWAETHWLNYTHFIRLESYILERDATSQLLPQAWTRQAAIISNSGQVGMDMAIPTYYSDEMPRGEGSWHRDNVDAIVVQIKNVTSASAGIDTDARKDHTGLLVESPEAGVRIRGFNLYLSLGSAPQQTIDVSNGSALGLLVRGASKQQFPPMKHLHDWQKGELESASLSLFLGRSGSAIGPPYHDLDDHRAALERANFFALDMRQDVVLSLRKTASSGEQAIARYEEAATVSDQRDDMSPEDGLVALGNVRSRTDRSPSLSELSGSRKRPRLTEEDSLLLPGTT